jgi:hypothetical protein
MDAHDISPGAFNTECPICFSEENYMLILSCLHKFHRDCLDGHTSLDCPTCRQPVVNWPPDLKKKILTNSSKLQSELESEDRRRLIDMQNSESEFMSRMSLFLQPPPQVEISAAMQYLREQGIPLRYIPESICVGVTKNHPRPAPGVLFSAVISQVMQKVEDDLACGDLEVEEIELDEENPFTDEDEVLMELTRNVRFIEI